MDPPGDSKLSRLGWTAPPRESRAGGERLWCWEQKRVHPVLLGTSACSVLSSTRACHLLVSLSGVIHGKNTKRNGSDEMLSVGKLT